MAETVLVSAETVSHEASVIGQNNEALAARTLGGQGHALVRTASVFRLI
jgi:hypothetical protein